MGGWMRMMGRWMDGWINGWMWMMDLWMDEDDGWIDEDRGMDEGWVAG